MNESAHEEYLGRVSIVQAENLCRLLNGPNVMTTGNPNGGDYGLQREAVCILGKDQAVTSIMLIHTS